MVENALDITVRVDLGMTSRGENAPVGAPE
jgi:hypothetical protein